MDSTLYSKSNSTLVSNLSDFLGTSQKNINIDSVPSELTSVWQILGIPVNKDITRLHITKYIKGFRLYNIIDTEPDPADTVRSEIDNLHNNGSIDEEQYISMKAGLDDIVKNTSDDQTNSVNTILNCVANVLPILGNAISESGDFAAKDFITCILDIGGLVAGIAIPPPFGQVISGVLGLVSTIIKVLSDNREGPLESEISKTFKESIYDEIRAELISMLRYMEFANDVMTDENVYGDISKTYNVIYEQFIEPIVNNFDESSIEFYIKDSSLLTPSSFYGDAAATSGNKCGALSYMFIELINYRITSLYLGLLLMQRAQNELEKEEEEISTVRTYINIIRKRIEYCNNDMQNFVSWMFSSDNDVSHCATLAFLQATPKFETFLNYYKEFFGTYPCPECRWWNIYEWLTLYIRNIDSYLFIPGNGTTEKRYCTTGQVDGRGGVRIKYNQYISIQGNDCKYGKQTNPSKHYGIEDEYKFIFCPFNKGNNFYCYNVWDMFNYNGVGSLRPIYDFPYFFYSNDLMAKNNDDSTDEWRKWVISPTD